MLMKETIIELILNAFMLGIIIGFANDILFMIIGIMVVGLWGAGIMRVIWKCIKEIIKERGKNGNKEKKA